MVEISDIIRELTNPRASDESKKEFLRKNDITALDLIDVVNYVTIERNFYKRRSYVQAQGQG